LDASHCAAIAGAVALGAVELAEIVEELDVIGTRPAEAAFFHYTSHSSRNRPSKSSTDPTDPSRPQFPMIRRKSPTVSRCGVADDRLEPLRRRAPASPGRKPGRGSRPGELCVILAASDAAMTPVSIARATASGFAGMLTALNSKSSMLRNSYPPVNLPASRISSGAAKMG
jgi:hypothetical protein